MTTGRFSELDGLRGLAAVAVLVSHFTGAYDTINVDAPKAFFDFPYGAFGVQLFFLISGFVILMSARRATEPSDFVISRASRIYPAYWLSLIIALAVAPVLHEPHLRLSAWEALLNFTMGQRWLQVPNAVDVYWTLAVELQFYVLIAVLLIVTRCRLSDRVVSRVSFFWLLMAVLVAIWAGPYSQGIDPQSVITPVKIVLNLTLAEYAPLFCAGMLAFTARAQRRMSPLLLLSSGSAVFVTGVLHSWVDAAVVAGICAFFVTVTMRTTTSWLTIAALQWLGKISYSLYIIHAVIGYVTITAVLPFVGRDWAMLLAAAVSIGASWLLYETGEKRCSAVLRRLLEKWRDRRKSRTAEGASGEG
ncbi:peptidoglycan/LPS O-acetylase OafA/YrhL [Pseudarthrobacter sp. W1I19]|uniref:acyltransferase family protein n=1 Tax=Pseudarthrobacter sp. W1I19 TaxID=3042288 RepID=UPI0027878311|nr:acyltransferase [Pseudarthrobacter sp. W1I19]MDQ0922282.1 peptidoglycan/LPS O-acetylase OafA/YrhL [Pseudarthrobacter sp. W1I19]